MARPAKSGLEYFPLDTDFDCDDRIRYIRRHGGDLACFQYLMILKEIYRVGFCYRADEVGFESLSELLRVNPEELRVIVELFRRAKLIDGGVLDSVGFITSRGIQRRYFKVLGERRVTSVKCPDGVLVLSENELPKCIAVEDSWFSEEERKRKEILKEKERKRFGINPEELRVMPEEFRGTPSNELSKDNSQENKKSESDKDHAPTESERFATFFESFLKIHSEGATDERKSLLVKICQQFQIDDDAISQSATDARLPLKKYPAIRITPEEAVDVFDQYTSAGIPPQQMGQAFKSVQENLKGKRLFERTKAYGYLIGWAKKQVLDQLISETKLQKERIYVENAR